jgi:hypothetical protein
VIHLVVPSEKYGGVYDYTCKLQDDIGQQLSRLVLLSEESVTEWRVDPDHVVVLQFSGYGFAKRGVPLWLLRALEARRKDIKSLGIYFHELYALGPPWSSSFWLSPMQRHIARRLVELSDFWMTNREGSAKWLRRFAGNKPHAVLPVFSNVGESDAPTQPRLPRIVVFGSPGLRQRSYEAAGEKFFAWAKKKSFEIHDIGTPIEEMRIAKALLANGVVQHGRLEKDEIAKLLGNAQFGLIAYPVGYVSKSGVFAAYCAHGLCPLLISKNYVQVDGLAAGTHYMPNVPKYEKNWVDSNIGQQAWEWYQPHRIERHTELIKQFLNMNRMM